MPDLSCAHILRSGVQKAYFFTFFFILAGRDGFHFCCKCCVYDLYVFHIVCVVIGRLAVLAQSLVRPIYLPFLSNFACSLLWSVLLVSLSVGISSTKFGYCCEHFLFLGSGLQLFHLQREVFRVMQYQESIIGCLHRLLGLYFDKSCFVQWLMPWLSCPLDHLLASICLIPLQGKY